MDVFITIPYLGSLEFDKIFSSLLTKVRFPKGLEELLIKRLVRTNKGETSRSLKKTYKFLQLQTLSNKENNINKLSAQKEEVEPVVSLSELKDYKMEFYRWKVLQFQRERF